MSNESFKSWRAAWDQLISAGSPFAVVTNDQGVKEFSMAPKTLLEALEPGRKHGDKPFLHWQDQNYTFAEFFDQADRLTVALQKDLGVRSGDRIAIAMRNRPEWMIAFVAAVQAGAIPVPVNSWGTAEELSNSISDSSAAVVFCDPQRYAHVARVSDQVVRIVVDAPADQTNSHEWSSMMHHAPDEIMLASPRPEDPALILYTSGTTGRPKGAVSSHKAVCQALYALDFQGAFAYMTSARRLQPLLESGLQPTALLAYPLFHVSGLHSQFLSALRSGKRLVILYKWDVDNVLTLIRQQKVTQFAGVPMMIQQLVHHERFTSADTDTLFALGLGGSAAPKTLLAKLLDSKPDALSGNGYGLTESNGICAAHAGDQFVAYPDSVGWPLPLVEVVIGDSPQQPVEAGVSCPIWIRTPTLMDGYWNKPEETAASLQDGWLFTGDVGYKDENDMIYITDRIKDIIIRAGENISAVEVEHCACDHPDVEEAAVFMLPDEELGESVGMVVYTSKGISEANLRAFMAEHLAAFKLPKHIWFSEAPLQRSATGKLQKAQVKREFVDLD